MRWPVIVFIGLGLGRASLGLPAMAVAEAQGTWSQAAPPTEPRQEVGVAEAGGKIYLIGGFGAGGSIRDTVEVYDPATNRWSPLAPLPAALHHLGAVGLNGKVYVVGGFTATAETDATFEYDPAANRWIPRAPMPTRRGALALAVLEGKVYAVGGARGGASIADVARYDPGRDRWTALPPMPTPRDHLAAGAARGRLYVAGGRNQTSFILNVLEEFDPRAGAWRARAPMPTGRSGIAGAVVNNVFYVFGGEGNAASPSGTFGEAEAYDPLRDRWVAQPSMPTPRHGIGAAVLRDRIYIPGGSGVQGFGTAAVHEVFRVPAILARVALAGCTACRAGDLFRASAELVNSTDVPAKVEVKAGVRTPDRFRASLSTLGSAHAERTLSPDSVTALALLEVTIPPGQAPGTWTYEVALLDPDLGDELSRDAAAFDLIP
jgi:N-acetylneuraminic acid mutarotase